METRGRVRSSTPLRDLNVSLEAISHINELKQYKWKLDPDYKEKYEKQVLNFHNKTT